MLHENLSLESSEYSGPEGTQAELEWSVVLWASACVQKRPWQVLPPLVGDFGKWPGSWALKEGFWLVWNKQRRCSGYKEPKDQISRATHTGGCLSFWLASSHATEHVHYLGQEYIYKRSCDLTVKEAINVIKSRWFSNYAPRCIP